MKCNNFRISYTATRAYRTEGWQPVDHCIGKLMASDFLVQQQIRAKTSFHLKYCKTHKNYSLELFRSNEAVLVCIEKPEGLTNPLALKTLHQLGKFIVYQSDGSVSFKY